MVHGCPTDYYLGNAAIRYEASITHYNIIAQHYSLAQCPNFPANVVQNTTRVSQGCKVFHLNIPRCEKSQRDLSPALSEIVDILKYLIEHLAIIAQIEKAAILE